jgi:hypothetical protein
MGIRALEPSPLVQRFLLLATTKIEPCSPIEELLRIKYDMMPWMEHKTIAKPVLTVQQFILCATVECILFIFRCCRGFQNPCYEKRMILWWGDETVGRPLPSLREFLEEKSHSSQVSLAFRDFVNGIMSDRTLGQMNHYTD